MIKKIIVCLCVFLSISAIAQKGSSSAYSFYGIGENKFKGTAESRSMGGISIFPDSTHVNLQNPAGYASLKNVTFSAAASYNGTNSVSNFDEGRSKNTTVDYLTVGIPLTDKWAAGIGLMSYSAVGYRIATQNKDEAVIVSNQYKGNGGVNRVFFNTGYKINENLSIGGSVEYNFGKIETSGLEFFQSVQYGTQELNVSQATGFSFNTGAMWQKKINAKQKLFLSAIYTPEANLDFANTRSVATVLFTNTTEPNVVDEQEIAVADTKQKLPTKLSLGAGFGEERKWLIGAEFTFSKSSNMQNRFEDITNATFENSKRIAVGGYYIPEYNSYSGYFKRITLRGGFRYENTGLIVNDKPIDDMAVTLGFGFPITGSFSNINLGMELGRKGTKAADLVRENYVNFMVSFSFNDKWFVKRKIN